MVAWSGSVPIAKVTAIDSVPDPVEVERMYSIFSTPLICCSSGAATVEAMLSADAPG